MKLSLIEKDAKELPANFAVVDGKTVTEGIANIRDAFNNNPDVNLVVWNGAADLISPGDKALISSAIEATPAPDLFLIRAVARNRDTAPGWLERAVGMAFDAFRALPAPEQQAMAAWRQTSADIAAACDDLLNVHRISGHLSVETPRPEPAFHVDFFTSRDIFTLRTAFGAATIFMDNKDRAHEKGRFVLRPGAETVWTARPFALAVMAAERNEDSCLHSAPFHAVVDQPGATRALEFMHLVTEKPMKAGAP